MSTTLNHLVLSRADLAEASQLADAGSATLARTRLLSAADHALFALAARSADGATPVYAQLDRIFLAEWLVELGAAPGDSAPVLRDLNDPAADHMQDPPLAARLAAGFGLVHALIDAYLAQPPGDVTPVLSAPMPMYGGPKGAMNVRGAEAAARGLARIGTALRTALRR
jgi:hypothetical protein